MRRGDRRAPLAKALNSTEGAHPERMSILGAYEHLRLTPRTGQRQHMVGSAQKDAALHCRGAFSLARVCRLLCGYVDRMFRYG
jgi:hypothetical protein